MKLPSHSGKIKDLILDILGKEFPLNAKEIFQRVTREHGREVTYQAVHKALLEAVEEGALVKTGTKYQLDTEWIHQLKNYSKALEQLYSGEKDPYELIKDVDKQAVHLKFDDISIFATTIATIIAERMLTKGKPANLRVIINHAWWSLRFNFTDFSLLQKINSSNPNGAGIVLSNSPFDRWIVEQYVVAALPYGGKSLIRTDIANNKEDLIVLDDYVIRTTFSKETQLFINEIYNEIHGLYDLLKFYYSDKLGTFKPEIHVVIEKNPSLAQLVAEKVDRVYAEKEKRKKEKTHERNF